MAEFVMPSLGADMEAGTLVEWLKKPGDPVKRGEIIAVVETQKGAIEVECFEDGILDTYLIDLGTKVPVGTPLAMIRKEGERQPRRGQPRRNRQQRRLRRDRKSRPSRRRKSPYQNLNRLRPPRRLSLLQRRRDG
jgi:pyruvate dehydrogenase E2 component (dihydrolipoamide acetyltransferase)